ncbi:MAG: hypothetical protein J6X16_01020 [Bacteroidales bacterium]|nr:hypothetical protein [Bacteroidales bacterium]
MKLFKYILTLLLACYECVALSQAYRIGDLYTAPDGSQGIVFYLHPDNSGGWVVALNDASEGCMWGEDVDVPLLETQYLNYNNYQQMLNDTAGYANTQILRDYQQNSSYAAGVVDFAHGWYLPSSAQLRMLYGQLAFISSALVNAGGTDLASANYWSSSECSSNKAWEVDFTMNVAHSGHFVSTAKSSMCRVRAIRNFSYASESHQTNRSYLWSTGDTTESITVAPTQTTSYMVNVSDGECTGTNGHTIVVNLPIAEEIVDTAYGSYIWNGTSYTESGEYTHTFTAANGCDSVVTLHLTILNNVEVTITATDDTICEGESVTLQTQVSISSPGPVLYVPAVAAGDILCTDGTTVKPSAYASSGKTAMGIVVYANESGHGWAIHLHEQGEMPWSTAQSGSIPNAVIHDTPSEAISDYDGMYNTYLIRQVANTSLYPAAWAVDYDNGWYLPASGQLYLMYPLVPILNASLAICGGTTFNLNSHWHFCSSSVAVARNMWSLDEDGYIIHYLPTINYTVRSMRNF